MKKVIRNMFVLIALSLFSCSGRTSLNVKNYLRYIEDPKNGLNKVVKTNMLEYNIQYKPSEYIAIKERKDKDQSFNIRTNELRNTVWFNVKIT